MATLPKIRNKLRNVSSKNKSLQDILQTMKKTEEIISVEEFKGGIHNTKIVTLVIDPLTGEETKRVHFYNRLNLAVILATATAFQANDIESLIKGFNLQGYDFTEDDLEVAGNGISAKATSLGYYGNYKDGNPPEPVDCKCFMDHQSFTIEEDRLLDDNPGPDYFVSKYTLELFVNGQFYYKDFGFNKRVSEMVKETIVANNLTNDISFDLITDNKLRYFVKNLTNKCGSFGYTLRGVLTNPVGELYFIDMLPSIELCPVGERKLVCDNLSDTVSLSNNTGTIYRMGSDGEMYLSVNGAKVSQYWDKNKNYRIDTFLSDVTAQVIGTLYLLEYTERANPNYSSALVNKTDDCVDVEIGFIATGQPPYILFKHILGPGVPSSPEGENVDINIPIDFLMPEIG